jgi:hypothetical protein
VPPVSDSAFIRHIDIWVLAVALGAAVRCGTARAPTALVVVGATVQSKSGNVH